MPRTSAQKISLILIGLMTCSSLISQTTLAEEHTTSLIPTNHTITKVIRGKTTCTDNSQKGTLYCGTDHWIMYVHDDGSRSMHVASETTRNGEVRHALIVVNADGQPLEGFMHNRSRTDRLGSSFVMLNEQTAYVATNDAGLDAAEPGIDLAEVEASVSANSLSTGPASADGLHFLKYDFDTVGEQARNIYWMGGSRQGTMVGSFRPTTHTYLGETTVTMPNGEHTTVDHFRMSSGTETWLTKEDRVVVRMDVRFGNITGSRYDLTEYEITKAKP